MRFKITLNINGKKRLLPFNYQYYISAWIYNVIGSADKAFANFLHNEGFREGNKRFKFFNFSPLDFGKPKKIWKENDLLQISRDQITLKLSFLLKDAAEAFIIGLFRYQKIYIGDSYNGLDLNVTQIERLPDKVPEETMRYRALSPVVISYQYPGSSYASYLSPENEEYAGLLYNNFKNKYQAVPNTAPLPVSFSFSFSLIGTPRSKLFTIKQGMPDQSKIRGYLFDFMLTAPPELHYMMLSCGVGEKNSLGFGWCEEGEK
ncbi:MAG: CRISPR-associated endoribonuclease Cas6 [Bacteroidales bacterium]|nr:CRISPR-associated endoribonuclease Cas6 [Bacteroidales bacterium]MDD3521458.1 CRISPR-associated endoribonuclease Cas6 [Bacteroidales bacterium]MDD4030801.1 CRISPR-associated endoribonuclease Cas6 [Bacteroidales bacterium]MDD4436106.1 CRISPR-associated endoribonuclease Cas6 [Bacteroidales bacterium]